MRKSILMGTREDVIKRRANKPVRNSNDAEHLYLFAVSWLSITHA